MKIIILKKLTLTNFKGIRSLSIPFGEVTNVYGNNATGKTTLMDAFLWLMFGKDSSDRKDFEIKTLDEHNQPFHKLDHVVEAVLLIDGSEVVLRREFREKWTKKRGETTQEFTGHETGYFWNDVPMKQEEYNSKISAVVDERLFKLLTNTTYFNSLKWQDRRAALMQIGGSINPADVLNAIASEISTDHFNQITEAIKKGKNKDNFKEFRAEIGAKKKKFRDELDVLPSRISEANLALPEAIDYSVIEEAIAGINIDIETVDGLLSNKSKAAKDHGEHIYTLTVKKQNISRMMLDITGRVQNDVSNRKRTRDIEISKQEGELKTLTEKLMQSRRDWAAKDNRKKTLETELGTLRTQWEAINNEQLKFNEGEFCCPACKREFDASVVDTKKEELTNNFNTNKSKRLNANTERGQAVAAEVKDLTTALNNLAADGQKINTDIETITGRIEELKKENARLTTDEVNEINTSVEADPEYVKLSTERQQLEEEINAPANVEDNSALVQRKKDLSTQLSELNQQLSTKTQREKQLARIKELEEQESKQANELASLEGIEFSLELLIKTMMDTLETRINQKFKMVRFKMFEDQINGGQVEACTTLVNSNGAFVPYPDANTAAKIQAGLDIINVLSNYYDVQAPVWVDNRESVVNLPETECQLINLVVSAVDRKLRIETEQLQEAV